MTRCGSDCCRVDWDERGAVLEVGVKVGQGSGGHLWPKCTCHSWEGRCATECPFVSCFLNGFVAGGYMCDGGMSECLGKEEALPYRRKRKQTRGACPSTTLAEGFFIFSCDHTSEFSGEGEFVRRRIERKEVDARNGALGYEKNEEYSMRTMKGEAQGRRKRKIMLSCMFGH